MGYYGGGKKEIVYQNDAPVDTSVLWVDTDESYIGGNSLIFKEIPTGLVNGLNDTFLVSRPYIPGSLQVFINGIAQSDYVLETDPTAGQFKIDAPDTGSHISVSYQHSTYASGNADTLDGFHASNTATAGQIFPLAAKTVDANGWTIYNYGLWKEYEKRFTGTHSTNLSQDSTYVLFTASPLPLGVTNLSNYTLQYSSSFRYAGPWAVTLEASGSTQPELSTGVRCLLTNTSVVTLSAGNWAVYVRIKEL